VLDEEHETYLCIDALDDLHVLDGILLRDPCMRCAALDLVDECLELVAIRRPPRLAEVWECVRLLHSAFASRRHGYRVVRSRHDVVHNL
jgi:hypothetical protein